MKSVARFAYVDCYCGHRTHLIHVEWWMVNGFGMSHCNGCNRPTLIKGDDGAVYAVGRRLFKPTNKD